MSSWLWAVILALQAHFGASYVVPIQPHLGVFNYLWPWAVGDHGLFGAHPNLVGIALRGSAGMVSALAALAVVGIRVPHDWWRTLATVGAVLELVLMIGFFGPTKLLPMTLDLTVLAALVIERLLVREAL